MYTKELSAQNVFERWVLMNQADGECLPLFSSSGIDFVYFSAMIIVYSINGNV